MDGPARLKAAGAAVRPDGRRICLGIAGISIEVIAEDSGMSLRVQGAAEKFRVETERPDVRIRAGWRGGFDDPRGEKIFDAGKLWQLYRDDGSLSFRFHSTRFGPAPYKVASFDPDFTSGEIHLNPEFLDARSPVDPLEYPLDELLVMNLLALGRGVEVHACGLTTEEQDGFLFIGQSGAGKTTMARLWLQEKGATILNDDRIVLRRMGEEIRMFGTPWHGDARIASPRDAGLKALFFLKQAPRNEVVALTPARAAARMYACAFLPFHDRRGLHDSLRMIEEIAVRVPCHEIGFVPDRSIIGHVLRS